MSVCNLVVLGYIYRDSCSWLYCVTDLLCCVLSPDCFSTGTQMLRCVANATSFQCIQILNSETKKQTKEKRIRVLKTGFQIVVNKCRALLNAGQFFRLVVFACSFFQKSAQRKIRVLRSASAMKGLRHRAIREAHISNLTQPPRLCSQAFGSFRCESEIARNAGEEDTPQP